ncbi:hypothetical protein D3C79_886460 [compost metagenome]
MENQLNARIGEQAQRVAAFKYVHDCAVRRGAQHALRGNNGDTVAHDFARKHVVVNDLQRNDLPFNRPGKGQLILFFDRFIPPQQQGTDKGDNKRQPCPGKGPDDIQWIIR